MLKYCYFKDKMWRCPGKMLTKSWKLQVKLCMRKDGSSNCLQYFCKIPRIAGYKDRIGVHFMLVSHLIFQQIVLSPIYVPSLKCIWLRHTFFLHISYFAFLSIFIKGETFRQLYTDNSRWWWSGESSDCSQSHHNVCTSLCVYEGAFCNF